MTDAFGPTVDVIQAAELMKVHPKTVLDKINAGELAAGKVGRSYVMLTRDVLALVERQILAQTAERMGSPKRQCIKAAKSLPRRFA